MSSIAPPVKSDRSDRVNDRATWSVRMILVCLVAVSVSLPIAWISITKVLLYIGALGYMVAAHVQRRTDPAFNDLWTARAVLVACLAFAVSLLWTNAPLGEALAILVKHAKLLEILLLIAMIRTRPEARVALIAWALGQIVFLLTSWLMVAGVPIPWTRGGEGRYVVFSSYLDQSIMFATAAAVIWHLRAELPWPRWLTLTLSVAALVNVLVLLPGRTGYAVAMTMIVLKALWDVPRKWRLRGIVLIPLLVVAGVYLVSSNFHDRVSVILPEGQAYAEESVKASSSGWRLNAWHRSVQAIAESPLVGHGVGSWTGTVKRLEGNAAALVFGEGNSSNPHQEYLLWGVELGIGGMAILLAVIISILRDVRRFEPPVGRSAQSALAAMAVACLFNSALYDGLIGDFFVVTLGILMAFGIRERAQHRERANP